MAEGEWKEETNTLIQEGDLDMTPTIAELAKALCKAQGKMKHAIRDANNPFFGSKYADLASVVDAYRPALSENGLSVVQYTRGMTLYTMLLHESGEWIRGHVELKPMHQVKGKGWEASEDPQSYGSCMSYARRYGAAAITGVATEEDDDGNAASKTQDDRATVDLDPAILAVFGAAKTIDELSKAWAEIPGGVRYGYTPAKDAAKARIASASKAA